MLTPIPDCGSPNSDHREGDQRQLSVDPEFEPEETIECLLTESRVDIEPVAVLPKPREAKPAVDLALRLEEQCGGRLAFGQPLDVLAELAVEVLAGIGSHHLDDVAFGPHRSHLGGERCFGLNDVEHYPSLPHRPPMPLPSPATPCHSRP